MNKEYLNYLKTLLKEDFKLYLEALKLPLYRGFNINTLKLDANKLFAMEKINCQESIFNENSYVLNDEKTYGNTLAHMMGLLYFQEPSASGVVNILDPKPTENILDMCAAPGGKSIQMAMKMNNTGNLISNEYDFNRSKTLLSNMERTGIKNALITSMDSKKIAKIFEGYFDRILVDAPCSGEGMFKKYPESMLEWSLNNVHACAKRQLEILDNAYYALKPEGTLVYSTCTLNDIENETVVKLFLEKHADMESVKIEVDYGREGINNAYVRRIMPYDCGEGQFIAKFIKKGVGKNKIVKTCSSTINQATAEFLKTLNYKFNYYLVNNDKVYGSDAEFIDIKCLRNKVLIGEMVKGRFEPHHHLYTSLKKEDFKNVIELTEEQAKAYIKGNVLEIKGYKGYVGLSYQNLMLGFGKGDNFIIKNKYPKGLRKV